MRQAPGPDTYNHLNDVPCMPGGAEPTSSILHSAHFAAEAEAKWVFEPEHDVAASSQESDGSGHFDSIYARRPHAGEQAETLMAGLATYTFEPRH